MIKTSDATFNKDVIEKKQAFALLFTSNTCPHCRTAEAIIKNIEINEQNFGANTYVLNSSSSVKLIEKYGIRAFPTMFFFDSDFKNKHTIMGADNVNDFLVGYKKMLNVRKKTLFDSVKEFFIK